MILYDKYYKRMWEVFVYLYVQHHTFESLNFNVKLYLGNGRPDCHGMKETGVNSIHGLM